MAHAHLMKSGLGAEPLLSNVLLNVYAKAGRLRECAKLFDEMPLKDIISWCTLISGCVSRGLDLEAFGLLKRVYRSGLMPNHFIISSVLKGCSNSDNSALGTQVHAAIIKIGLVFDSFVEVGLISIFFYEIPVKCLVSWNAMISGYVQHGFFSEAMDLSRDMCRMGFVMDLVAMRVVVGTGSALAMINFCKNLHAYSIKIGLDTDNFVVAEHVKLLSRLGEVDAIGKLFARVRKPDACLFALTIVGYYINGHRFEAVKHAEQLLRSGLNMSPGAIVSLLNLCLFKEEGSQVHAHVLKNGHGSYLSVSNALISTYANCEAMEDAEAAFLEMPEHDIISWTAIMSGHAQNAQFGEAFGIFQSCRKKGIKLDEHALATIINACSATRTMNLGQQCHALVLKLGIEFSEYLAASFLHMYSKCGDVDSTTALFYSYPCPHGLVPINVMLAGYSWNSLPEKAIELFCAEHGLGFIPNEFSFSAVLGACSDLRLVVMGQQLHSCIIKRGFESFDVVVGNAMIKFYVKSGNVESACRSFYSMNYWDSNSYAVMISGYAQNRCNMPAMKLFCQMHQSGLSRNPIAFASVLRCCVSLLALKLGKQVHASVLKTGFASDPHVSSSLVGMYSKSSGMDGAVKNRNEILTGDHAWWSSIVAEFSQEGKEVRGYGRSETMKLKSFQKERFGGSVELLKIVKPSLSVKAGIYSQPHEVQDSGISECSVESSQFAGFLNQLQDALREVVMRILGSSTRNETENVCKYLLFPRTRTEENRMVHILRLPTYCFSDLPKGGLFCARSRKDGQQDLTEGGHQEPAVKFIFQAFVLDKNPEFISLVYMRTTALVYRAFVATPKGLRYVDFQIETREGLTASSFSNGFLHWRTEKEDGFLVFLAGSQMGTMAFLASLKEHQSPSIFSRHPWDCG
ncbi:unnamed protein product [Spirodela intermedia]|uniref:Uncharacterized protein n=1 Tax=Spirodela intermedia TaxID=51605 RepID=A0A7I8ISQ3_SPIIN|nr:unnamed protein product [Spirodela intermedia]CAA6660841.1 unnamed protein product [Spirodela intermedia]